jgi:ankyrin repeat protein
MINLLRSILSFFWLAPFLYLIINYSVSQKINLSKDTILYLFITSCISAIVLLFIWIVEFLKIKKVNSCFTCIDKNDLETLDELLLNINPANCIRSNETLLQYAILSQKDAHTIAYLISKDFFIEYNNNPKHNLNYTLFYLISYYKFIDERIVSYLLNQGANPNFVDTTKGFEGLSLLQVSILRNNLAITNILLKNGASLDYYVNDLNLNAIMLAAKYCNEPLIIDILINFGANINDENSQGYTPILIASEHNPNPEIIKILYYFGATLEQKKIKSSLFKFNNVTPLRLSVINNNIEVITTLIKLGDDIYFKDSYSLDILFVACSHNPNLEVIKLLLLKGLEISESVDQDGNSCVMGACYFNKNITVIKYIINKSSNSILNKRNKEGYNAIDYVKINPFLEQNQKQELINSLL